MRKNGNDLPSLGKERQPLTDLVREALREAILKGRFKPGDRLVEGRLAAKFGVSRNPVREALKALANEGVVRIVPRRGAFVAGLSLSEAREVMELRAWLDGLCARLAARRLEAEVADRLERHLREGEALAERKEEQGLASLNAAFHAELERAGANGVLAGIARSLRLKTKGLFEQAAEARTLQTWFEHAGILRAVLAGDEESAARLATRHLAAVAAAALEGGDPRNGSGAA